MISLATHLSVRLCWHESGWNGSICQDPEKNNFCSYLDFIRENRTDDSREFEQSNMDLNIQKINLSNHNQTIEIRKNMEIVSYGSRCFC